MFSHLYVILSTEGGVSEHALGQGMVKGVAHPLSKHNQWWPSKGKLHILLERILVGNELLFLNWNSVNLITAEEESWAFVENFVWKGTIQSSQKSDMKNRINRSYYHQKWFQGSGSDYPLLVFGSGFKPVTPHVAFLWSKATRIQGEKKINQQRRNLMVYIVSIT